MRTLPLYVLSILVLSILLPPDRRLTQHIVQYLTLFQNFAWPLSDGWYDVTWSLAVEEWFYFAFSAVFLFASTAVGRRGGLAIIIIFLIVPLSCRFLVPADAPWDAGIRKVMVLRLDSIAYGVAAALFIENSPNVRRHWIILIVAGLALEIIAFLVRGTTLGRPVVFNLMDIGAALCLPAALTFSRISGSAVGWAVTSLSTTSYGIYLVHTPVLRLLRDHSPFLRYHTVLLAVAMLLASIALAGMSWIALEQPILKLRPKQTRRASNAPTASFALES
jgi:peptidoglycan/LPS O-acetylase OafA/YrhL